MSHIDMENVIDVDSLPTLPAIAIEAIRLMEGELSNFDSVADLLKNDQVLSSRILHYANSAYIGARKVSSISQAVSLLGFNAVRSIILSASIFDSFSKQFNEQKDKLVNFWLHSIGVAAAAEILAEKLGFEEPEEAYIAGLLHDLGKLICYIQFPEKFAELCEELEKQGSYSTAGNLPLDIENNIIGSNHMDIGKLVAEKWEFPENLATAIWLHHQPVSETINPYQSNISQVVRFADVLCVSHNIGSSYFLASGPYCHEHFHFALENLVLHHQLSPAEIESILDKVYDRIKEMGQILGFWDESIYQKLVSSANVSLGGISMNLEKDNRQLLEANRVLEATCEMTRRLHAGLSLSETTKVIIEAAQKAFNISTALCIIRNDAQKEYIGHLSTREGYYPVSIPAHLAEMQTYSSQPDISEIENEAVQQLQKTSIELAKGISLDTCLTKVVAGSRFLATFFLADKNSRGPKDPILGEILIDFADALLEQPENKSALQHNFEAFTLTVCNIVERLLMEGQLARQAVKLAEASRKMEENQRQLFHSHRLATVGQLAAGAAHEINNPLTIISLNIQIMQRLLNTYDNSEPIRERLQTISGQERRISKIIQDLMGFARPNQPKYCPSNIYDIFNKVLSVIGDRVSMTQIDLINEVDKNLPKVMVDPLQIEQVFMNLLINANHAMPDGGTITIAAKQREDTIDASVVDSGSGIDPKHISKIFDPFFTTKKEGEGTGLGLAICNSIVEHNGGQLRVKSQLGEGTSFTVSLPIDKSSRLRAMKSEIEQQKIATQKIKPEKYRILVIDDEHLLNDMLQESLRSAGYEVDGAYDGVEGIGLLRYKKYDLILLDIRMPRKDGLEVLNFAREEFPQVKVVIITGLASKKEIQETVNLGAYACLKKPFLLEKVLETIEKALETE